jgi:hypothetical protein
VINRKVAKKAGNLLVSNDYSGPAGVAKELVRRHVCNTLVHRTTLRSAAFSQAKLDGDPIITSPKTPLKCLSLANKQQRLAFCKANKNTDWTRVLFTDRKKFYFKTPKSRQGKVQYVRKSKPYRRIALPNHPSCVNVYLGLSYFGTTLCHLVEGTTGLKSRFKNKKGEPARNITTQRHKAVFEETFLPEGERLFRGHGSKSWTLLQDNDPAHREANQVVAAWNKSTRSQVHIMRGYPGNSPDLNCLENLWGWADGVMREIVCADYGKFRDRVTKELQNPPLRVVHALIDSMPRRLKACVAAGGDMTNY